LRDLWPRSSGLFSWPGMLAEIRRLEDAQAYLT